MDCGVLDESELGLISTITSAKLRKVAFNNARNITYYRGIGTGLVQLNSGLGEVALCYSRVLRWKSIHESASPLIPMIVTNFLL